MKREAGIGIIEVMIALIIVAVGLIGLSRFNIKLLQDSTISKERSEAVSLAEQKLEELRNIDRLPGSSDTYTDITDATETVGPAGSGADVEVDGLLTTYTRSWSVTESADGGIKSVDVSMTWSDRSGEVSNNTSISIADAVSDTNPAKSGSLLDAYDGGYITPTPSPGDASDGQNSPPSGGGDSAPTDQDAAPDAGSDAPDTGTDIDATPAPTFVSCMCRRTGNSSNAKSKSSAAACTDACCAAGMPSDTPSNGFFGASCPL